MPRKKEKSPYDLVNYKSSEVEALRMKQGMYRSALDCIKDAITFLRHNMDEVEKWRLIFTVQNTIEKRIEELEEAIRKEEEIIRSMLRAIEEGRIK